jgi:hypothetical protein
MNAKKLGRKYLALCMRIEKLHPKAAKYMREKAPELPTFGDAGGRWPLAKDPENLDDAFRWYTTPQGHIFWQQLHAKERRNPVTTPPAKSDKPKATKRPKAKGPKKHVWEPRTLEIRDSVPKTTLRALILESVDEINQLGTENARLKNQITLLKQKAAK